MSRHNKTYKEYKDAIANHVEEIDYKPYSHNLISLMLGSVAKKWGKDKANKIIKELKLEELGWRCER